MASINVMEYLTIASLGNASDFGDLQVALGYRGGNTDGSRGVFAGDASRNVTIDYINITSLGNATDFGDMSAGRSGKASVGNGTRGVWGPGGNPPVNNIDYITIATTGDATEFGDATSTQHQTMASSGDA